MYRVSLLLIFLLLSSSCKSQRGGSNKIKDALTTAKIAEQKLRAAGIEGFDEWLEERKKSSDFILDEAAINAWGYELLYDSNDADAAVKVFLINMNLYPTSSNAYDSAGEGYLVAGDYEKSVEYYRKAIELQGRVQFHQLIYLDAQTYKPSSIPADTTKLFQTRGNWDNEIAFVYVQGGPDVQLNIGPRDGLHLMPNHSSLLKIYPYQGQMFNPEMLATKPILTEEQSAFENAQSIEILDRVIRYLVARKKKVFLIGHSYGASISMEYVHSKENLAQKVVLMGLDLDEDISSWESLKSGEYIRWEDGQRPYARTIFRHIPDEHPSNAASKRVADNLTMIVKNNMAKKYTDLYKDEDFKNIISVYSTEDEANGRKSQEEIAILKQKGTTIVEVEGDHHDMLTRTFMTDLYEHLVNAKALAERY